MAKPRRGITSVVGVAQSIRNADGCFIKEVLTCGHTIDLKAYGWKTGKEERRCPICLKANQLIQPARKPKKVI